MTQDWPDVAAAYDAVAADYAALSPRVIAVARHCQPELKFEVAGHDA
jgi:hypothetical protein